MSTLTVVARLKAKSGSEAGLERELRALVAPTRAEKGCLNYDLHRSAQDPGLFVFHENWESRALWDAHMNSAHIQAFSQKQGELTESWELFDGEKIA
ncbi:putative quinol monooxygenase [uncultured Aureimonas sp.]|uniref:putative quinol monooxygenase n=1 Tax=uncultured Aureimonas sp. TaxID=1604662 RepID=UPI0025D350BB|nr:putative quinol monooxygenase [uncultured Aureimonas sp.]